MVHEPRRVVKCPSITDNAVLHLLLLSSILVRCVLRTCSRTEVHRFVGLLVSSWQTDPYMALALHLVPLFFVDELASVLAAHGCTHAGYDVGGLLRLVEIYGSVMELQI